MSISRIPEPDFVYCTECRYRRRKKEFSYLQKKPKFRYYCTLKNCNLYGQAGCTRGALKDTLSEQTTLEAE